MVAHRILLHSLLTVVAHRILFHSLLTVVAHHILLHSLLTMLPRRIQLTMAARRMATMASHHTRLNRQVLAHSLRNQ